MSDAQVKLVACNECFNGYTTRRGRRKCGFCGGDGYIIPGRPKLVVLPPPPQSEYLDQRGHSLRVAARLENQICIQCGNEPLVTKLLGERCAEAMRANARNRRSANIPIG